jgi:hypothetical protein
LKRLSVRLAAARADVVGSLGARLDEYLVLRAPVPQSPQPGELDASQRRRLKVLGYLDE